MTAPAHLTDEQVANYRSRKLPSAELLDVDTHLAGCEECRERLYVETHASAGVRDLRADLAEHLSYEQLVACSEGLATNPQRVHLRDCAMCRDEVQDLSRFRTQMAETPRLIEGPVLITKSDVRRWQVPIGIAAAVVLLVGGLWTATRPRRADPYDIARQPAAAPAPPPVVAEATLPPPERELLNRAIASHQLERAPILDELIVKPGKLLSARPEEMSFDLMTPVGTAVLTDRPLLRWTPVIGATSYVVSIFDEKFAKVVESPTLTGTDWRPEKPLPRAKVLIWQVTATARGRHMRAPRPPAPEARFEVVSQEVSDHIAAIQRQHPGNALLKAVLYANAGALDDANEALNGLDPDVAQRYRESLAGIRISR